MHRLRIRTPVAALLVVVAAVLATVGVAPAPAGAQERDGCVVTVNGRPVERAHSPSDAFELDKDDVLRVSGRSSAPVESFEIQIEYGLFKYPAKSGEPSGDDDVWASDVELDDYARFGTGLYKIRGTSTGAAPCDGWAYIEITGQFALTTVAGSAALVMTLAGVLGMVAARRPARGGRAGDGHRWLGSISGLVAGIGAAVLLQQLAVVPMTPELMVGLPLGALLLGLALGWPRSREDAPLDTDTVLPTDAP